MNLSCVWLLHQFAINTKLSNTVRHQAMVDVLLVLHYKLLTSLLVHFFKYPAAEATAEATYERLSYKFDLKRVGSWGGFLLERAEDVLRPNGIHAKTIKQMEDDDKVVYILSDIQTRIRGVMMNIMGVFVNVHNSGERIRSSSLVVEHDGLEILKDKTKGLPSYIQYINSVVNDRSSFVKTELLQVIQKAVSTMPPELLERTLYWISDNYGVRGKSEIESILNDIVVHAYNYLLQHKQVLTKSGDFSDMLTKLKGAYMSSRTKDPLLLGLRSRLEALIYKATGNKNSSILASVRTGMMLYIVLRTITMKHYVNVSE